MVSGSECREHFRFQDQQLVDDEFCSEKLNIKILVDGEFCSEKLYILLAPAILQVAKFCKKIY